MKIKDLYYKHPILYDYLFSTLIIICLFILVCRGIVELPDKDRSSDLASDIGSIGLTVSGFILTLLTILLTFKSGEVLSQETLTNESSPFKIFLRSKLYSRSIDILKHGVLSLLFVSILIYTIKALISKDLLMYIYYPNIVGIIIILTTFLRCFYVLGLILKMQESPKQDDSDD